MGDSADLVKVLRRKCNDLEDDLDAQSSARDEALAAKAELVEEIASLRTLLQNEREARLLEDVKAGQGKQVLANLFSKLEQEQARTAELRRSLADIDQFKSASESKLKDRMVARDGAKTEISRLEAALKEAAQVSQEALIKLREAEELANAEKEKSDAFEHELHTAKAECECEEALAQQVVEAHRRLETLSAGLPSDGLDLGAITAEKSGEVASQGQSGSRQQRLQGAIARAEERVRRAEASHADAQSGAARAEAELAEARRAVNKRQLAEDELSTDRDCAVERMQEAEQALKELRAKFGIAKQQLEDRQAAAKEEEENRCKPLEIALHEVRSDNKSAQKTLGELEMSRREAEKELRQAMAAADAANVDLLQAQAALESICGGRAEAEARRTSVEDELREAEGGLAAARAEAAREAPRLAALRPGLDEAESRLADQEASVAAVRQALQKAEAEVTGQRRSVEDLECNASALRASFAELQRRTEVLSSELQQELSAGEAEDTDEQRQELDRRIDELTCEWEQGQKAVVMLEEELEADRRERMVGSSELEELQRRRDVLQTQFAQAEAEASRLAAALAEEQQLRARGTETRAELEAGVAESRTQLTAEEAQLQEAECDLQEQSAKLGETRRAADALQEKFNAVHPEHQDLFAQYSEIIEQIDAIKGEKRKLQSDSDSMAAFIALAQGEAAESLKQKEAVEAAPPSQIAVSDVLISVVFDDATSPLELRPWDTNFADVVSTWLAAEHKAPQLLDCLVKYLRDAENSAIAFPLHLRASLQKLYDDFGN